MQTSFLEHFFLSFSVVPHFSTTHFTSFFSPWVFTTKKEIVKTKEKDIMKDTIH